jgi:hypothetical protein
MHKNYQKLYSKCIIIEQTEIKNNNFTNNLNIIII